MSQDKQILRESIKKQLAAIGVGKRAEEDGQIHQQLFSTPLWKRSETVAVTISGNIEIDTREILRKGWEEGKTMVVPKCTPRTKKLEFRTLTSFEHLESVYFGLQEPVLSLTQLVDKQDIDLVIVPGLLYDRSGYRIGFGGGFYDRFLADYRGTKVALARDIQIAERLPAESFDIPVDWILTSGQLIETEKTRKLSNE